MEITALFIALFLAQTAIYAFLVLRLKRLIKELRPAVEGPWPRGMEKPSESVLRALKELSLSGTLSSRELSRRLGLSREHTARLLKQMVERGLVIREGKPYRYRVARLGIELLREYGRGG